MEGTRNYSSHGARPIYTPWPSAHYCWAQLLPSEHETTWKFTSHKCISTRVCMCVCRERERVLVPQIWKTPHWKMPSCFSMMLFSRILCIELWKEREESERDPNTATMFYSLSWNLMYIILNFNCSLQYLNLSHATVYCYKINTRLSRPHLLFRICAWQPTWLQLSCRCR